MTTSQFLVGLAGSILVGEIVLSAWVGRPLHSWKHALSSASLSALTGVVSGVGKLWLLALYIPLHSVAALHSWTGTWWEWALALCAYDLLGYWFHRWSHRTALGWAIHHPHHQSEEMNLGVAMRTSPLRSLVDWPTILPLAVLGVPAEVMVTLYFAHVAGQYWLHNTWMPILGPLEWALNTPSHHRVHHGCQGDYQDANYAPHFIVWDRMFGTFVPETEQPVYGVTRPVAGWDPIHATFGPFRQVLERSRDWSVADRLQVWLRPPGWSPDGAQPRPEPPPRKDDLRPLNLPGAIWHTAVGGLLLVVTLGPLQQPLGVELLMVALGVWTLAVQGQVLEDRRPSAPAEIARGAAFLLLAPLLHPAVAVGVVAAGLVALGGIAIRPQRQSVLAP